MSGPPSLFISLSSPSAGESVPDLRSYMNYLKLCTRFVCVIRRNKNHVNILCVFWDIRLTKYIIKYIQADGSVELNFIILNN